MKNRTAGVLVGLLVLVCFGLALSVVYPFTTSDPHAVKPPHEGFTVSEADAYTARGSIVVDGRERLAFDGVVAADGAWYLRIVDDEVVSESYHSPTSGAVYRRLTVDGRDDAERRRRLITEDEDRELVREDWDGDSVTFLVEENATGATEPVSGTVSVFVESLSLAAYDAEGADSSAETVYEPQSGWYDGRKPYRLTDASGAVRADADTHAVESADVSWDLTTPAGTYAEYALVRLTTDEPTTYAITFEFDSDDTDLERPTWVGDVNPS